MSKDFLIANLAFFTQRLKKDLAFFYRYSIPTGYFFCSSLRAKRSNPEKRTEKK
jgi:hypothetical protein